MSLAQSHAGKLPPYFRFPGTVNDTSLPQLDGRPLRIVDRGSGQEVKVALVREEGQQINKPTAVTGQPWPDRP